MRLLITNLCLWFAFEMEQKAHAQTSIHGAIKDSAGAPLAAVNILLLATKDSMLVKGTVTSASGEFSFTNIPAGKYFTTASCVGYLQSSSPGFEITGKDLHKSLGAIRLTENRLDLKAVTVSAKKPLLEQKIDRLIINVENSITSAGNTALQILERSPGVIVDHQNNLISINGKEGVMLMMNGKITRMPVSAVVQMLAGMNADNIEKIELITTPPANLDAEGNAGYINIVLKENNSFGTNGSYSATVGYAADFLSQASLNINHRKGKVNVYGALSYSDITNKLIAEAYTKMSSAGTIHEIYFVADRLGGPTTVDGRVGLDIDISKRTILGFLFSGRNNTYTMNENNRNDIYKNYNIDTVVQLSNSEVNRWADYSANINLQHDLKQKGKLSFNFDYIHYLNDQEVNYGKKHYDSSGAFIYPMDTRTNKYTLIDFWVGAFDYSRSLSDKVAIEGGLKQTVSLLTNNISLENSGVNAWVIDKSFSAKYKLREMYPAVYTSLNMTLSKMTTLKIGLRYEYTFSNLGTEDKKDIVDRKYGNLFPTVFLSHKLTKNTTVNLSYSKRITRPTFSNLAPFTYFASPTTIVTGNPTIQPSINNTVKVDYVFKQFLFSLAVGKETNAITGFQPESDSVLNRIVYTPQNLESIKNITGIFSVPVVVNTWWIMQFNVTALWQQINANYKNQYFRQAQSSVKIIAIQRFTLPKKYFPELAGFFQSAYLDGIIYRPGFWSLDVSIKKILPGKYGSLSLNATNIFNSIWSKREWDWPAQNLVGYFDIMPSRRSLKLTYSKNFGKDKLKDKRARVTGADDAKSRVD